MWILALFFIGIGLAVDAQSDCQCYEAGNYTGRNSPISNAYMSDSFSPCYSTQCSYVAYSGDDNHIWTHLTFRWGTTTNSGGQVQIFDGPAESGTPLVQIAEGEDVPDGSVKSKVKSSTSRIFVKYSQTAGTSPNVYYGVIRAIPNGQ